MTTKKIISLLESFILIVSIFSFSYLVGMELKVVDAQISEEEAITGGVAPSQEGEELQQNQQSSTSGLLSALSTFVSKNQLYKNFGWAVAVNTAVRIVGSKALGENAGTAANAISIGYFVGRTLQGTLSDGGILAGGEYGAVFGHVQSFVTFGGSLSPGAAGLVWGGIATIAILILTYKKTSEKTLIFECNPYESARGGNNCEKCNIQGILPCNEYQCKSLGQGCELINKGTKEEKCTWVNRLDTKFPIITPWEDVLTKEYDYTPDNTISPPSTGVKIVKQNRCLTALTPFSFGILTDKPAKCKLDIARRDTFDQMQFWFGGDSILRYNHTQILSLPSSDQINAEAPELKNDGNYELFVRCMDANGNYNLAEFVFKFCIDKGPRGPPIILGTSLNIGQQKTYIAYEQKTVDMNLFIDEPAECKWSIQDKDYEQMENTMTDCKQSVFEMNADMAYSCKTTLTGLKDRVDNEFYFRCKDIAGSINKQSYNLTITGTQPLTIDSVSPVNITIKDSTNPVKVNIKVETSAGAEEGISKCKLSETGNDRDYSEFLNTNSNIHSQQLQLPPGSYKYYIKCTDIGGNTDSKIIEFNVESDTQAPQVVRLYNQENQLKLITNEEAECVYSTGSCNYLFDDGIKITTDNGINHFLNWNTNSNYYIRCKDSYGNQPVANKCSIIARPFSV